MNNSAMHAILSEYCRRGWKLFPCRAKAETWTDRNTGEVRTAAAKTPLVQWREAATSDPAQIKLWMEQYPHCMWGCATGSASGFWALDLDRHEGGADGMAALREYVRKHGLAMQKTLAQRTAGGGWHLLFKMPEGADVRNATAILGGVDVRGSGGYIVVAPSHSQDTGKDYEWQAQGIPIAPPPPWLLTLISQNNRQTSAPGAKAPDTGAQAPYFGPDGGTAYGLQAIQDELATLRAAEKGTRNNQLNICAVKLFSLAAGGELDADKVTRKLEAAAVSIGLPFSEATATIASARKAGFASPRTAPDTGAAYPPHAPVNVQAPAPAAGSQGGQGSAQAQEWDPPVDFATYRVPALDTAKLPPLMRSFVEGLAEALQVPRELVLAMALATVSTASQWRYMVLIRAGYREPTNTYVLCPLDPGNRKSATVAAVTDPLRAWERIQKEKLAPMIKEATSRRLTLEKAIAAKREKAAKATAADLEALQREIEEMEDALPIVPRVPRLLADNVTPEALAVLMAEMRECLAILTAEGGIFDILAGLYSGKVPNLDLFLKAHSGGDAFRVDRRNAPPVILDNPLLTLGISPQPVTLTERTASRIFRARGLDGRFLYFLPPSMLGARKMEPAPLDPAIKAAWEARLLSLLPLEWTEDAPEKLDLRLSDGAYRAWLEFAGAVERELAAGGEFSGMTDWGGKLPGAVARIAGLFHILTEDKPEDAPIAADTMAQAVYMGAFLTEHAKAAYGLMGSDERTEGAKVVLDWIRRKAADTFTRQSCWQGTRGTFHHMEPLREALRELEERNFIREILPDRVQAAGRPPAPSYKVNPLALKG